MPYSLNVYPVYIDHVGFQLKGTFHDNPTTRSNPAFLFAPPLRIKSANSMDCIEFTPADSLFYWSFDPSGKSRIAEEDWEELNIPKLELRTYIGPRWDCDDYNLVREFLSSRSYDLDGRQYAREHGHPELIRGA